MKVENIMTKNVITVSLETKVEDVASILTKKRIHGVPVTEEGEVIGIITETDFFTKGSENLYLPSFIDFIKKTKFASDASKKNKTKLKTIIKARAKDIMTGDCMTVTPEMGVNELLDIFKKTNFHTLPVTNKDNLLCGIVTLADIVAIIGELG